MGSFISREAPQVEGFRAHDSTGLVNSAHLSCTGNEFAAENGYTNGGSQGAPTASLTGGMADSTEPRWSEAGATGNKFQDIDLGGLSDVNVRIHNTKKEHRTIQQTFVYGASLQR